MAGIDEWRLVKMAMKVGVSLRSLGVKPCCGSVNDVKTALLGIYINVGEGRERAGDWHEWRMSVTGTNVATGAI